VSILTVPMMVLYDAKVVQQVREGAAAAVPPFSLPDSFVVKPGYDATWYIAVIASALILAWAIWQSKREGGSIEQVPETASETPSAVRAHPDHQQV